MEPSTSTQQRLCFICEEPLQLRDITTVKKKGLGTLLASSVLRKETEHERLLTGLEEIDVHSACQVKYNNEKLISAHLRRENKNPKTASKPTRSACPGFDFNNRCFLCDDEFTEEYRQKQLKLPSERRNLPVKVTIPEMQKNILSHAKERGDEWGKKVEERLISLSGMSTGLVAVNAEYHRNCLRKFYCAAAAQAKKRPGRPYLPTESMEIIFNHLEENRNECQFALSDLLQLIPEESRPNVKTVKKRLIEKYDDNVIIADLPNKGSVICFRNTGNKILTDNWYSMEKKENPEEERARIVVTAGRIILEDIRSQVFNTSDYPPIDNFLGGTQNVLPQTLILLLHTIILTNKKGSPEPWKTKCLTLAHAIMMAVRPRSFLSSILIGVATYIYKKVGSKTLVELLYKLGISASYKEASRLEGSYIVQADKPSVDNSTNPFSQFIFDNADVNVNTLDGHGTFHAMGGIMAVTPRQSVAVRPDLTRLNVITASDIVDSVGDVEVKQYHRPIDGGLKTVKIFDIGINPHQDVSPCAADIAWLFGKSAPSSAPIPGWNGFMEMKTRGEKYECSQIVPLPFINAPPSDYSTIYTSILTAIDESKRIKQKTTVFTVDQPLHWKARDITANGDIPELQDVVVRLGGFHLLMSFLAATSAIMAGSGLKQLFSVIFAGNSVDKILSGHAYARAVRAHSLAYAALGGLLIEELQLTDEETQALTAFLDSADLSDSENPIFQSITVKFSNLLKEIENRGPTAALWIQYFRMCTLMKNFIRAERMGDWDLHLNSVREMIPYFHAAGHLNYAKSAHLYYQDMMTLKDVMDPQEFENFTTKGYFTIRRSDKFWSGIWSDMTIEQVLMRGMKAHGGLTRGRGLSDNVLHRWIVGMLCLNSVCEQLETFTGVRSETSEQHVELRPSRVARETLDINKLRGWFADHPPFPVLQHLMSLGSGAVASSDVNCYTARSVGITSMKACLEKGNFADLKLKRKDRVVTLASVSCTLKIKDKKFTIDPLTLFQRICIMKQSDEDLKKLLAYELAPFPMALFSEEGMRKGKKSTMYEAFTPIDEHVDLGSNRCVVIDGGYLLHKVVWSKAANATFQGVCKAYVDYVTRHHVGNVTVVFDGYPDGNACQSTKSAERHRRSLLYPASNKFIFSANTPVTIAQDKFLANDCNKRHLISMLKEEMVAKGIGVRQAVEDADVMIVETAISQTSQFDSVTIVGEDVDLLVLMTALASSQKNIYFAKTGRGNTPTSLYSAHSCNYNTEDILFLHAISGCDTTSAPYGHGKKKVMQVYQKNPRLTDIVRVFKDSTATHSQIADAGEKFLVQLYGGLIEFDSLNDLRFKGFSSLIATAKLQLPRLPPTSDASKYHSFRVYHQVQMWLGRSEVPTAWGWKLSEMGMAPIPTAVDAAPANLLQVIRCKCATGCSTGLCSCKKAGLLCSAMCKNCVGNACDNSPETDIHDDDSDREDDVTIMDPQSITQEDSTGGTSPKRPRNVFYEP